MPQVKYPVSLLAMEIRGDIKTFLKTNSEAMKQDDGSIDAGTGALADAIAYGIAKAMNSTTFNTALKLGVGPASAGTLISTGLTLVTKEL